MSGGERERSHVVRLVIAKKLSQRAASERLGICVRQVKRLVRAYRSQGDAGLVSKQRGRVSPRRLRASVRERIERLLRALSRSRILLVNPAAHSKTAVRKINHLEPSTWARNRPKMAYSWRV